jgi:hypothetical protein
MNGLPKKSAGPGAAGVEGQLTGPSDRPALSELDNSVVVQFEVFMALARS